MGGAVGKNELNKPSRLLSFIFYSLYDQVKQDYSLLFKYQSALKANGAPWCTTSLIIRCKVQD